MERITWVSVTLDAIQNLFRRLVADCRVEKAVTSMMLLEILKRRGHVDRETWGPVMRGIAKKEEAVRNRLLKVHPALPNS